MSEQTTSPVQSAVRDDKGKIIRPDWDKPRGEDGRFLPKSVTQMHEQWAKEGGVAANLARIMEVQTTILSHSADAEALQDYVAELPQDIQLIAADHMRLATARGPNGGAMKLEQFLNALSPSQFDTFHKWWRGLSTADQDVILGAISL